MTWKPINTKRSVVYGDLIMLRVQIMIWVLLKRLWSGKLCKKSFWTRFFCGIKTILCCCCIQSNQLHLFKGALYLTLFTLDIRAVDSNMSKCVSWTLWLSPQHLCQPAQTISLTASSVGISFLLPTIGLVGACDQILTNQSSKIKESPFLKKCLRYPFYNWMLTVREGPWRQLFFLVTSVTK